MSSKGKKIIQNTNSESDSTSKERFPIVGIGASAGGLKAVEDFFSNIPSSSGMAFVLIMHLSPDHKSNLAEIIQHKTSMETRQVLKRVTVQPDNVYIIPPNYTLSIQNGKLVPKKLVREFGHQSTIDFFMDSLASDQHSNAIGIILSGSGTDGTKGIQKIKEMNGLTMVQSPSDAEYDSMPKSAINTGIVDYVLSAPELAKQLIKYKEQGSRIPFPLKTQKLPDHDIHLLKDLFTTIRKVTGHDFSNYKRSTVLRRIARRMQMNQIDSLQNYVKLLHEQKSEVKDLFNDLLIRVTNFFRDPEAYEKLNEEVIPRLFQNKKDDERVRVWSVGCATGEEAYSLAILLDEFRSTLPNPPDFQIFASDIDKNAINIARSGIYSESVTADISKERLNRYFVHEINGYRIKTDFKWLPDQNRFKGKSPFFDT